MEDNKSKLDKRAETEEVEELTDEVLENVAGGLPQNIEAAIRASQFKHNKVVLKGLLETMSTIKNSK